MHTKKTNMLIWLILGAIVVIAVIAIINTSNAPESSEEARRAQAAKASKENRITSAQVEGDTIVDTLKTVQAKNEATQEENKVLREEVNRIKEELSAVKVSTGTDKGNSKYESLNEAYDVVQQELTRVKNQVSDQTQRFLKTEQNGYEFSDQQLGFGEVGSRNRSRSKESVEPMIKRIPGYAVVPVISTTATVSVTGLEANGTGLQDDPSKALSRHPLDEVDHTLMPYRTIPARGTLFDAKAMTALIGRVPVGGSLKDPFPVKFIVGKENMATNGIKIPNVEGTIFEGVASGNWNLSCVSVKLTAATFTFQDGRVQHLQPVNANSQLSGIDPLGGGGGSQSSIGYITNTMGAPCIQGKRVTDAPKQMATVGLLGLAASYFDAKAQAEVTNQTDGLGGSQSVVTGDPEEFAKNEALQGTIDNATQFYLSRNRDTFDAIVAPPGAEVILHITSDLLIDYDSKARKVSYHFENETLRSLRPM